MDDTRTTEEQQETLGFDEPDEPLTLRDRITRAGLPGIEIVPTIAPRCPRCERIGVRDTVLAAGTAMHQCPGCRARFVALEVTPADLAGNPDAPPESAPWLADGAVQDDTRDWASAVLGDLDVRLTAARIEKALAQGHQADRRDVALMRQVVGRRAL